jgi:uncharacterized protein
MKKIFIIHGWEGSPNSNWFQWLKKKIEDNNPSAKVHILSMPNPMHPIPSQWVKHLSNSIGSPDENTYLIGHSLGVITILRYLESFLHEKIGGALLVAGFAQSIHYQEIDSFTDKPIDFPRIRKNCDTFAIIDSRNDPYIPIARGDFLEKILHAKRVTLEKGGHVKNPGLTPRGIHLIKQLCCLPTINHSLIFNIAFDGVLIYADCRDKVSI